MNKLLMIILTVFVGACSTLTPHKDTDIAFEYYIIDFEYYYNVDVTIPINFVSELPGTKVGRCRLERKKDALGKTITIRSILIRRDRWVLYNEFRRKALIYHELIHCQFDIMYHIEGKLSDNCPDNIMTWRLPTTLCIQKHWTYYREYWRYK